MVTDYQVLTEQQDFEEKIVKINRVSKKTAGGNRFGFSVLVVVGDKKGRVGVGLGKAPDVARGIRKASSYARRHLISVPLKNGTIPHEVLVKVGAAKVLLKPASPGTGLVAGGPVRAVLEAAGVKNVVSKILGTSNQASNVYATLEAIKRLRFSSSKIEGRQPEVLVKQSHQPAEKIQKAKSKKGRQKGAQKASVPQSKARKTIAKARGKKSR